MNPFLSRALAFITTALPILSFLSEDKTTKDSKQPAPRKKRDMTKLTEEQIQYVIEMFEKYDRKHTHEEITRRINEDLGLNKSKDVYGRIYRASKSQATLQE